MNYGRTVLLCCVFTSILNQAAYADKEDKGDEVPSADFGASETLLELMVRIAAHPDQWEQVHNMLRKIDADLLATKRILKEMANNSVSSERNTSENNTSNNKHEREAVNKSDPVASKTIEVQTIKKAKNLTQNSVKTNNWPFEAFPKVRDLTTKYPWQVQTKSFDKNTYARNFAYHRATGSRLYHSNINDNPKAYIAVSVIAPKPLNTRAFNDDPLLEHELRQLKPWTHSQNLKNMASIRSRWVIRSDGEDAKS